MNAVCVVDHTAAVGGTTVDESGVTSSTGSNHRIIKHKKAKVLLYSLPSVGPGASPGVHVVSQQVTF